MFALPAFALLPNTIAAPVARGLASAAPSTVILALAAVEKLANVAVAPEALAVPPTRWIVALPADEAGGPSILPAKKRLLFEPIVILEFAAVDLL
jgi:hypothetical protein